MSNYDNVTNPGNFQTQVLAQKGYRLITPGTNTATRKGLPDTDPTYIPEGETYRAIIALDDATIDVTSYVKDSPSDALSLITIPKGMVLPGLFENVGLNVVSAGSILLAIA